MLRPTRVSPITQPRTSVTPRCTPLRTFPKHVTPARPRHLRAPRLASMASEVDPNFPLDDEEVSQEDFIRAFDSGLGGVSYKYKVGDRIEGFVFDVDNNGVYVDFGGKQMGYCSSYELGPRRVSRASDLIKPDTKRSFEIGCIGVNSKRLGGEVTLLSRMNIVREIGFKRLRQLREFGIKLQVTVTERNTGGYVVENDMGMEGFLPGRQAIINPATSSEDDDELVGQEITVKVIDLFEDSDRFLLTQRGVSSSTLDPATLAVGTVLEGVVEGVMPYGVFIETDGIIGLVHSSQVTGGHMEAIGSVFAVGDRLKVMVLGYDKERGRLSLSTKRLEPSAGDILSNPQLVYEKAEEMAAKFRKEVELAAARVRNFDVPDPVGGDISIDTSRLTARNPT